MVRIADTARRILLNAPDREQLLKQAALRPSLHTELWQKYNGDVPPDASIRHYLIFDKKFNEDVIDGFIAQYKGTLRYAKLWDSDKLSDESEIIEERARFAGSDDQEVSLMTQNELTKGLPVLPSKPPAGLRDFPLYLSNNQKAVLYAPATMTKKEFELLRMQIQNSLLVMEATALQDDEGGE